MGMGRVSYELYGGYFILMDSLRKELAYMSDDLHQWAAVTIPGTFPDREGRSQSFALIGYSNPDPAWLLNPLCFIVPMVALGGEVTEYPPLLTSLSPHTMTPLTKGLYLEDGELKYDCLEDWNRVWRPIRQRLWPKPPYKILRNRDSDARKRHRDRRIEFVTYLHRIAASTEDIRAVLD
jgi:hypothetical protein